MPSAREIDPAVGDRPAVDRSEIGRQVARESERRTRLGVPAAASGVLYLLSGIILTSTLSALPTVGLLQGLAPALRGEANPAVSPRAAEVRYVSHHAFALIAGSVLQALAVAFLVLVLLFLLDAVRFRRPETTAIARPTVLVGGTIMALVIVAHQVAQAITTHSYATGHDFSSHATDQALTQAAALQIATYLGLLAGIGLTAGMVIVVMGAGRTGLIARWMMILGIFAAVLAFTPIGAAFGLVQELIPAFWLVAMGILLMGRLPSGDPPAWAAGEARPWPSQAELRAKQAAERDAGAKDKRAGKGGGGKDWGGKDAQGPAEPALSRAKGDAAANGDVAPEPAQPAAGSTAKRRRKRGSRR